jgi:capsular exopolysaccharide synthesis family protein
MQPPDPNKVVSTNASEPAGLAPALRHDLEAAQTPASLSAPPSLGTLMQAFRRCWKFALLLALLGGAAAAGVAWLVVPPEYLSSVQLRISSKAPSWMNEPEGEFPNIQKAQMAMIKSASVVQQALDEPNVAHLQGSRYTVASLTKGLLADFTQGPEIMRVSLGGSHAEDVAAVLNAVAKVYLDDLHRKELAEIDTRLARLEDRQNGPRVTLEGRLTEKIAELHELEQKFKIQDPGTVKARYDAALANLTGLQREQREINMKLGELKALLTSRQQEVAAPPSSPVSESEVDRVVRESPAYKKNLEDLALLEKEIAYRARVERNSAELRAAQARRAMLREHMEQQREKARTRVAEEHREKARDEARKEVRRLKEQIKQKEGTAQSIKLETQRARAAVEAIRVDEKRVPPAVEAARHQITHLKLELARADQEVLNLSMAKVQPRRVTLQAEAPVPTERSLDRPIKFAAGAFLGAFALVLIGVSLLEARSRRVYSADDVRQGLGLPVVATIPALPPPALRATPSPDAPLTLDGINAMTESVDALRTMLLNAPQIDGARVVMITSAIGGEGKTTLASHLAASLARAWRNTLLIDGDLRNPAAHTQFDLPGSPGFCEALRGEVEFENVVKPTSVSRLWLLPAGKCDAHALQALAQDGVSAVFERLKEQFDFIVIDSSPVLPVPDALLLAKHTDAVLLAVLRDVSRTPAVYAAQQRLQALGVRTLGAVVVGEKVESYGRTMSYPRPQ